MRAAVLLLAGVADRCVALLHSTSPQSAALKISDQAQRRFASDGVLVLHQCAIDVPQPLKQQGCPCAFHEFAGVDTERRLAAALACTLLRAPAVRDPVGEWGTGWTHAHDHYAYSSLLEQPLRSVVVILPREPVTLTLKGDPAQVVAPTPYSSTSHPAVFSMGSDDDVHFEAQPPPPEPEICLDAGDGIVLRGDRSSPPGGLGGGALVYHFSACEPNDRRALFLSPLLEARAHLARSLEGA